MHAIKVVIDTVGVIVAGSTSKEVSQLAASMTLPSSCSSASCFGRTAQYSVLHAAMLNGMAGSTMEYEEGHAGAMGHPAIQILPALLAVAETENLSGAELLRGLICGYEAACRVSFAASLRPGMHPTGSWGVIGAALGVGVLKGRSAEELAQIADLAACSLAAPWVENAFSGWSASCLFAGAANQAGIFANLQFESGLRAAPGSLEQAFTHFFSDSFKWDLLTGNTEDSPVITANYFKPYPTCRYTHAALDAVQDIRALNNINIDTITEINVYSFKAATHQPLAAKENIEAARFSVPYLIAIFLRFGRLDLTTLTDDALADEVVQTLSKKVRLFLEPQFEEVRPKENPARVEIIFADGNRIVAEVRNGRGGVDQPLSEQGIEEKFLALCEPVVGQSRARQCLTALTQFDKEPKVRTVIRLLQI